MGLKRGDVVIVALPGDHGKPRPALILESDHLAPTGHVLLCPGTSHLAEAPMRRYQVEPNVSNGLRETTQFQIDKITPARRERCAAVIGKLDDAALAEIGARILVVLGLAD